jgi:hypothetical protein
VSQSHRLSHQAEFVCASTALRDGFIGACQIDTLKEVVEGRYGFVDASHPNSVGRIHRRKLIRQQQGR